MRSAALSTRSCSPRGERGGAAVWLLALVLLGGVAFAVYWFGFRQPAAESSQLAATILPAEVELVGGLDIARLLESPDFRSAAAGSGIDLDALDRDLASSGVALSDFRSLVFGGRLGNMSIDDAIVAIEAATDAKAAVAGVQLLLATLPEALHRFAAADSVQALDGGVVVAGGKELLDRALAVSRGEGAALGTRQGLDDVRAALDPGAILWVASPMPEHLIDMVPRLARGALGGVPSHFGFSATLDDRAELRAAIHIPGADGEKVASALEMLLTLGRSQLGPLGAFLEDVELQGRAATVIANVRLTRAQLLDLVLGRERSKAPPSAHP